MSLSRRWEAVGYSYAATSKATSNTLNFLFPSAARNHVNRLCLAAGVTLIESGSAGYLGQVTVIRKVSGYSTDHLAYLSVEIYLEKGKIAKL